MAPTDTSPAPPTGQPYTPSPDQIVTEWSEAIYAEFKDWGPAASGVWERWDPDYLVLKISSHRGMSIEPVWIDTCEDELTINFGYWECHLPGDGIYDDTDSTRAAKAAQVLASDWLEGRVSTAIYFNADDTWCGSKLLETPEDFSRLADIVWIESFNPVRVEIRKSIKSEWQHFRIENGTLADPLDARSPNR